MVYDSTQADETDHMQEPEEGGARPTFAAVGGAIALNVVAVPGGAGTGSAGDPEVGG